MMKSVHHHQNQTVSPQQKDSPFPFIGREEDSGGVEQMGYSQVPYVNQGDSKYFIF